MAGAHTEPELEDCPLDGYYVHCQHLDDPKHHEFKQVHEIKDFNPRDEDDYGYETKYIIKSDKWEGKVKPYKIYITRIRGEFSS